MTLVAFALAASLSFSEYVAALDATFEASPLATALHQAQLGHERGALERTAESPFRLSASATTTLSGQTGPGLPASQPRLLAGPTASAAYATRSGLSATLTGSYSITTRPEAALTSGMQPFSVSLDLSYDLVQGGLNGPAWLEAFGAAASATAQSHDAAQRLLDERIGFGRLMISIYSARCVVDLLSSVRGKIDETVAAAGLKLETGIMGQRDYLNFASLGNSFATQQVQLEATLAEQQQSARGFGPAASQLVDEAAEGQTCDADVEATQALARQQLLTVAELEQSSAALPASRSAKESLRAASLNLDAVEKRQRASVSPFVKTQLTRSDYLTQTLAQVVGGVSVEWTIPGERNQHATQEAALGLASAQSLEKDARLRATATLLQLSVQLASQVRVIDALSKGLRDSTKLIEVLKAQQLIGAVDSLNFATAYLNDVAIRQALLGAWATVQQTVFALKAYQTAVK